MRGAFPKEGLFADKEWRLSTTPFPLSPDTVAKLRRLGPVLHRFLRVCDLIYRRSVRGSLPAWVADHLDRGKPAPLLKCGRSGALFEKVPSVIRPDLILEDDGLSLVEIDAVPGGIGLTTWLNETFAAMGEPVLGGPRGMLEGMESIAPGGADVVISEESRDYRPEMEWLAGRLGGDLWGVKAAESYRPGDRTIYRFFELFDLPQLPSLETLVHEDPPRANLTPPLKPALEEKLWLALFWSVPLRETWRRELRTSNWSFLRDFIPFSWIMDPAPIPHHAVVPRLELSSYADVGRLSQRERQLVLKISGFSESAWGSRGVSIGEDLSQQEWMEAVREALDGFSHHPYLLQEFRRSRVVKHPHWDAGGNEIQMMRGRVRLCPYYFVPESGSKKSVRLGGVLATICPEDKKKLHGMRDAVLVPCVEDEDGF